MSTIMGFFCVTLEETSMNLRPSSMDSTYRRMTPTPSSSPMASMKSTSSRSALFPRLMKLWKPMSSLMTQSRTAVPSAPLWEMKPILPPIGMTAAKLRLRGIEVLISPRQLGPWIRIPYFSAISKSFPSRTAPSCPVSLKPADMTTRALTPFIPHSSVTCSTLAAGIETTTRSTSPGTSRIEG